MALMQNETPPMAKPDPDPQPVAVPSWMERLGKTKVTPLVFLAFFGLLAAMSGLAALVGYGVSKLARPAVHDVRP